MYRDQSERDLQDQQDSANLTSSDPSVVLETIRRVASAGVREEYEMQNDHARAQAAAAQAFYQFFRDNPRLNIQANEVLIRQWCHEKHASIKADSIKLAVTALGNQLAVKPLPPVPPPPTQAELAAKENKRLLNSSPNSLHRELRKNDRARVADNAPVLIPYTGKELLQLPARVLRNLMSFDNGQDRQNGAVRRAVNKLIADYILERDAALRNR
jgi:hypothetical protein